MSSQKRKRCVVADEKRKRARRLSLKDQLEEKRKTVKEKGIKYHGLTRRIKEIWPNNPSSGRSKARMSWCGYRDPIAHGNAVDVQLSACAKLGKERFIKEKGKFVDPCTIIVLNELEQRKLKLISSQYCLYDSKTTVKTHLDIIAEAEDGSVALIELKATIEGDEESYKRADGVIQLRGGATLPNSYYHRNMIQLLMTSKMLYLRYGILPSLSYVMRVGNRTLWCYPMDREVLEVHNQIYETFVQNR